MKRFLLLIGILPVTIGVQAQTSGSVGIGTTSPHPSAALDVTSTSKGLLLPRLTDAEMQTIAGAEPGLLVYNTTANKFYGYQRSTAAGSIIQNAYTGSGIFFDPVNGATGQTFTSTANATLTSVTVYAGLNQGTTVTDNLTMRIYLGNGIDGPELGRVTRAVTLAKSYPHPAVTFSFTTNPLLAGQEYTFLLQRATAGQLDLLTSSGNPYAGGTRVIVSFNPNSVFRNEDTDLRFSVGFTKTGDWVTLN